MTALGPVSLAVLTEIAAAPDGMTAVEAAQRLGCNPVSVHQAVGVLEARGCIAVASLRGRIGPPAKVWAATTHGKAALEAATKDCLAGNCTSTSEQSSSSAGGARQAQTPAVTALEATP